jgi:hypothetical protein
MGPLRPTADPFDIGTARCGVLHNPAASRAAEAIAITMGDDHPEIDRYIGLLGYAPIAHIDVLRRGGAQIAFAPTVAHYLLMPKLPSVASYNRMLWTALRGKAAYLPG